MPKVKVDGIEVEVPQGATVLQACEAAGKEIPRFCYHERLSIAGNCRMCLVEVKPGPPKPQASCALPAADNQEIRTDSAMVKAAREGVMEFLLINHPLDCPICDQGGECDLQDQSLAYGRSHSRYTENKRAVTEGYMGPIIKTIMTRCIQCTRCVRFGEEVAGVEDIGAIYRGEDMQITTYLEKAFKSELSGNAVDLCPVGALTHKPVAFEYRPWELRRNLTIDVMDGVGTNIRADSRGRQVMRVLPRINEDVNEEWAHDKTRYHVDGLVRRRLDRPFVRMDGKLVEASWDQAFDFIAAAAERAGSSVAAIAGDLVDCETMYAAKALVKALGSDLIESRQTGMAYDVSSLGAVSFNPTIAGVEDADAVLLIGSNLRWEAPLVNTRVRKAIKKGAKVFAIGPQVDLTYKLEWLGDDLGLLAKLPENVVQAFDGAKRPLVIVGPGALKDGFGAALSLVEPMKLVRTLEDGTTWNGFGVVHTAAARMGALMLGFAQKGGIADVVAAAPKLTFFLGADEVDFSTFGGSFKVFIGHHGDKGAHHADVILPGATYAEKPGTYVNMEGRVQRADRAVFPPGDAREDWSILRALSDKLGRTLPFDSFEELRAAMANEVPELAQEGLATFARSAPALSATASGPITYPIADFYLTNAICRASPTMQRCSAELLHGEDFAEAGMTAFFQNTLGLPYGWAWFIATIVGILVIALPLMLAVAMVIYADRKIWAAMALRRGPNVVGPLGLLQSFADGLKVFLQETIIPSAANRGLFLMAPIITFTVALIVWAVVPFQAGVVLANINVGQLYILAASSLGVYGVIISGWSSNSKYPFYSALRASAQMVSYEVAIGFVLVTVVLWAGSFNLSQIVEAQRGNILGIFNGFGFNPLLFPMWVVFLVSSLAETARPPFDLTEAESELVAGYQTEYSSMSFALFWLGEYANVILMCTLNAILFWGGYLPPIDWAPLYLVPGILWLSAKIAFFFFVFSWIKATVPRYRYDQLMRLGWKIFLPLSLIFVFLVSGFLMLTRVGVPA